MKKVLGTIIAVVAVVAILGYVTYTARTTSTAVSGGSATSAVSEGDTIVSQWQEKLDAIGSSSDRATMRNNCVALNDLANDIYMKQHTASVAKELENKQSKIDSITAAIKDREEVSDEWFAIDYETRLADIALPDTASADNCDKEYLDKVASRLVALKYDFEYERDVKGVWFSSGEGSLCATVAAEIDAEITRTNDIANHL